MAQINHDTAAVWEGWQQRELRIAHCQSCGAWINLPKQICPECWSDDVAAEPVDGAAHLGAYSLPRTAPGVTEPVVTGVVSLDAAGNARMLARIVGCSVEELVTGLPLVLDWREDDGHVLPQFTAAPATTA
jgi:uncharacterized OB-fold protein